MWFKKLLQSKDTDEKAKSGKMKLFKWFGSKATVEDTEDAQLKNEIDVVPRTEITASRQTLNNITLALNNSYGESSGESTRKSHDCKANCGNKFCCDVESHSHDDSADNANESITESNINKRVQIKGNKLEIPSWVSISDDIVEMEPVVEDTRTLDVNFYYPLFFSPPPIVTDYKHSDLNYKYVDLKSRYYQVRSSVESKCIIPKNSIENCMKINEELRAKKNRFPESDAHWKLQDYNDDRKHTKMCQNTAIIAEFFKLHNDRGVPNSVPYLDIEIDEPDEDQTFVYEDKLIKQLKWRFLKAAEMKEKKGFGFECTIFLKELLKKVIRKIKHPRNKTEQNDPAQAIEAYTLALAQDETSIFGQNIHNFIACTRESKEKIPQKVMRNMRQFMNGMKNFLAKHGEKRFDEEVDNARLALNRDEFLNLDQILEGVMHQLVVAPLRDYLNELFVDYYGASGDIQLIIDNMLHAQNKDPFIFGVRKSIKPPPQHVINRIAMMFAKLHEAELPSEKLDLLLNTITVILENTIDTETDLKDGTHLLCDDFLPLFVYVMCKCGFHFAEVEAEYMWGLMHPTQMSGQPGYYVTSLCSAALIVKDMKSKIDQENADGGVVSVRENDNSLDSGYQL